MVRLDGRIAESVRSLIMAFVVGLALPQGAFAQSSATDPLPSWNETPVKRNIMAFVSKVATPGSPNFVRPEARIAVFDNDGTLWAEQPVYSQLLFALDQVKTLAPKHPEWKTTEPFASILKGDTKKALAGGKEGLAKIVAATHTNMTTDEFQANAQAWIATARHPVLRRNYAQTVYQPMLEMLRYLRANGFKTFIVSGGEVEFMRAFAERVYGIPPEQVIGTSFETVWQERGEKPVLVRKPKISFNDDKEGKPVAIQAHIGRRPIMAFGNSDGDLEMLKWTAAGDGPRFCFYVRHNDATREFAYDRKSNVGRLDKGLDVANARGWTVLDMVRDWKTVFPPQR